MARTKNSKIFNWVKGKLIQSNGNVDILKSLHEQCKQEIDYKGNFSSYERDIRQIISILKDTGELDDILIPNESLLDYSQYDRNEIVSIITDTVIERNEKITLSTIKEVLQEHDIPEGALLSLVPDYSEIIKTVYKNNMLHIDDEVKEQALKNKYDQTKKENKELKKLASLMSVLDNNLKELVTTYKKPLKVNLIKAKKSRKEAILYLSDLHFGETVDAEEVLGMNIYNPEIAKKRMDRLFSKAMEYCQLFGITTLNIHMIGDMVSGRIHEELLESNALLTIDTILQLSDYTSMWIQKVSSSFKKVNLLGMSGNHGRFTKKPTFKHKNLENFDYLMYKFIEQATGDCVDSFELPKSFLHISDHFGYKIMNLHGDILRGGTGLMPVSGTWARDSAKLNGLLRQNGKEFDCMVFGHFHTGGVEFPSFDSTKIIVNGSLKGTDEFSLGAVKTGSRASQQLLIIDQYEGLEINKTIFVD